MIDSYASNTNLNKLGPLKKFSLPKVTVGGRSLQRDSSQESIESMSKSGSTSSLLKGLQVKLNERPPKMALKRY